MVEQSHAGDGVDGSLRTAHRPRPDLGKDVGEHEHEQQWLHDETDQETAELTPNDAHVARQQRHERADQESSFSALTPPRSQGWSFSASSRSFVDPDSLIGFESLN